VAPIIAYLAGKAIILPALPRAGGIGFASRTYLYITDAPKGHVSKVWFDNIVVADRYIGPIQPPKEERLQ